jgi:hypothetical protein
MKKFLLLVIAIFGLTALAQDAGIGGKWHFALDTEGGARNVDAEFTIDADGKVTGKFGNDAVAGTFKDGKLELAFPIHSDEAGDGTLRISGKLDKGSLVGGWDFSGYSGTFTASR